MDKLTMEKMRDNKLHEAETMLLVNKAKGKKENRKALYSLCVEAIHRDRAYLLSKIDRKKRQFVHVEKK